MLLQYFADIRAAHKIEFTDPRFQEFINLMHWGKLSEAELKEKMNLSDREYKIYKRAYAMYSVFIGV